MPVEVQDACHGPVGEDAAGPRARHRGGRRRRLQPHRHGQRPRSRRQRDVERPAPPLQHRRAAAAGHRSGGGDGDRRARVAELGRRPRPARGRGAEEIERVVTIFRELRETGAPPTAGPASRRRPARCRRPRRSRWSPTGSPSPPTSATATCARPTSPPASSAPSCAIRARRDRLARSTSRGWCAIATAGATSTRLPRAGWPRPRSAPARHPPPRAGLGALGQRALDDIEPDVVLVELPRPTPHRRCDGSPTSACGPPVALLGYSPTTRRAPSSRRSPSSAPSGRRVRWAHERGVEPAIDLPMAWALAIRPPRPAGGASISIRSARCRAAGGTRPRALVGRRGRAPRRR